MFVRSRIALIATSTRNTIIPLTISLLVLSSPFIMSSSPQLIAAAGPISPATKADERLDTNNYHSTINRSSDASNTASLPSTAIGTPTIQAPLQIPRTLQSNDLVNSLAFYEVTFITSTTGAIDKIRMDFPAGTNIAAAGVIERVGIGGGTLLKSGGSITYDVTTAVSVPAGTFIRLEIFGIKNPANPSTTFTATITTRDSGGNLIDGPSLTNVYTMKQIGTNEIADNSITSTKPNESFMKRVTLIDDEAGNAKGWNPDNVQTVFRISEPAISPDIDNSFFTVEVRISDPDPDSIFLNVPCTVTGHDTTTKQFGLICSNAPPDSAELHYVVGNLPEHVICGPGFCRQ